MKVPLTTGDFLRRAAAVYGARTGIIDEPGEQCGSLGELTYARVFELARAQAAALDRLGIGPGERVAIISKNSARLLISLFGVTAYGRILTPINFRLQREEIAYIVEHSGASLLLVDPELAPTLEGLLPGRQHVLSSASDEMLYAHGVEPQPWSADEDATATLNYTSGTTARPKGVQLTHRNLWINATVFGLQLGVSDRDTYLHCVPMFHCNGWGLPYVLAGMGATQVVLRQVTGAEILRRVEQHGVTLTGGAPIVVSMVLDAAQSWPGPIPGRDRVRMVVAGAPPPRRVIERMETELGWEFVQIYGLTETSPLLTMNRGRAEYDALTPDERAARLSRAGVPSLGTELRVDAQGEVLARANVVLDAYWREPEATSDALEGGWFHTGDGGTLDDEAYLTISDRKKDVIITGGENVSSIEVEDALSSHAAVAEVAVIGVPDDCWGESVKAIVVVAHDKSTDEAELIAHCRRRLAHYKCPKSIEFRDALPRTSTGKLQKFKLRAPYWQGHDRQVN